MKAYLMIDHESSNELSRVVPKLNKDGEDTGTSLGLEEDVLAAIKDDGITLLSVTYSPVRDEIVFRKALVDEDEDAEPSGDTSDGARPLIVVDWELV